MQCYGPTSTANAGVNNTDKHRVFGKVAVTGSQYPRSRGDILWPYIMCNINDMCIRSNTRYDAFHYTYISITNAEVGHKSDNWTCIEVTLLSHTPIKLPFSKWLICLILYQGIANKTICYALIHLCAILAKMSTVVFHTSILYFREPIFHSL